MRNKQNTVKKGRPTAHEAFLKSIIPFSGLLRMPRLPGNVMRLMINVETKTYRIFFGSDILDKQFTYVAVGMAGKKLVVVFDEKYFKDENVLIRYKENTTTCVVNSRMIVEKMIDVLSIDMEKKKVNELYQLEPMKDTKNIYFVKNNNE